MSAFLQVFLILAISSYVLTAGPGEQRCRENEEFRMGGPMHEPACFDPSRRREIDRNANHDSCFCIEGYIRESARRSARCIPERDCPQAECGKNEVPVTCGDYCQRSCGDTEADLNTCKEDNSWACVTGCECANGFIRADPEDELSSCIRKEACRRN